MPSCFNRSKVAYISFVICECVKVVAFAQLSTPQYFSGELSRFPCAPFFRICRWFCKRFSLFSPATVSAYSLPAINLVSATLICARGTLFSRRTAKLSPVSIPGIYTFLSATTVAINQSRIFNKRN